jgi:hypothetical protein
MARKKYTPVDHYTGSPSKEDMVSLAPGVDFVIQQWPSLAFKTTISIDSKRAKFNELKVNGWAPKVQGNQVVISHKTRNFPMPWVDMIVREFVA